MSDRGTERYGFYWDSRVAEVRLKRTGLPWLRRKR